MRKKAQERLAKLVRGYMRKTGKSQKEFAREACVTLSVLRNAITEGNSASDEKMRQIAEAVGADWNVLLAGEERAAQSEETEEQTEVERLKEALQDMASERNEMEQRWRNAATESDEAVKQLHQAMRERDDATEALAYATANEHKQKARADALELELLRMKARLYDQMMEERE